MLLRTLSLLVVLTVTASAQAQLSGSFQQNPGIAGGPVTLEVSATAPISLTSGCGLNAVRAGSPTGPIVFQPFICPRILITVVPGGAARVLWDSSGARGGVAATPGLYFIEVSGRDASGTLVTAHFPIRLDDPTLPVQPEPTLTASVSGSASPNPSAALGGQVDLTITDPSAPGGIFFLAASSTTNTGASLGSQFLALDQDAIFGLTFPTVLAPQVFQNFVGALDAGGRGGGSIVVPPAILPQGFPLAVQGAVITPVGGLLTNPVSLRAI